MRLVYFGTYTSSGRSRGIYASRLDDDGRLSPATLAAAAEDPSWLVLTRDGRRLYAANERQHFEGRASGAVSAFTVDGATGRLAFINQRPSEGASPCHLALDTAERHLLVANYHGGSAAVLPVADDGSLGAATHVVHHEGRGPNPDRQEGPHVHSVHFVPGGGGVLVVDLGLDRLVRYTLDPASGRLVPATPPYVATAPGSGPRHLCFHPGGAVAWVDNELAGSVTTFARSAQGLRAIETVPTLPRGFQGENTTAEVAGTPDGRFLYVSNRGHDSLAIFSIDPASGTLTPVDHASTLGRNPRHFAIDPSGRYLVAANQDSDEVVVFRIDPATGQLTPTGSRLSVPHPVCVRFAP
jgi:6-phosphogluconolactonase